MKYFADLRLKRTLQNPLQIVILKEEESKMYAINSNNLDCYIDENTYWKYKFGEDELVEITLADAEKIVTSWGGKLLNDSQTSL
ncbi:MAG: hypothetical protein PHX62_09075 [Bacilli bacterium]|nr:hypothetical protein [Bacilli bacterium]